MISARRRKPLRELWLDLPRTLLIVAAIAVSIFGVGFAVDSYAILKREVAANIKISNPPSAVLTLAEIDSKAVAKARSFPGIADAESRRILGARIRIGPGEWRNMFLFGISDFADRRIERFNVEKGNRRPGDGQVLIERSALSIIRRRIGDTAVIRPLNGDNRQLKIVGTVHDPGQLTPGVYQLAYGYATVKTLKQIGGSPPVNELNIIVNRKYAKRSSVSLIAKRLSASLERDGYKVNQIEVPTNSNPAGARIDSFLFLIETFSLAVLILSAFLTTTIVSSLLSEQIRQIGVMKAVGADTRQIMQMYLSIVFILSMLALAIAIPLSTAAGRGFSRTILGLLNFNMTAAAIPHWAYLAQIALGLAIPVLTAIYPVYRGSRVTVREAINSYGVNSDDFGNNRWACLTALIRGRFFVLALSLRNTFRRRVRTALAIAMLAVGGASFISALGTAATLNKAVDDAFAPFRYDIEVKFDKPYISETVRKSVRSIREVKAVETWGYAAAIPKYGDGTAGSPVPLLATPTGTTMYAPPIEKGRRLRPNDTNAVVINTRLSDQEHAPKFRVGDKIDLDVNGRNSAWRIVGTVQEVAGFAAYAPRKYFDKTTGQTGQSALARISLTNRNKEAAKKAAAALEERLAADGFKVMSVQTVSFARQVQVNHIFIQLIFLLLISTMIAAVGAFGLASTMYMNVMERVREIGIMRSIGATTGTILRIVVFEGLVIAVASWIAAVVIAVPITSVVATQAGNFLLRMPLNAVIPFWAPASWLAIVVFISLAAGLSPALWAARITVREVLAYE